MAKSKNKNAVKKSDAELAAMAGNYYDTWKSGMVEGMGSMATLCDCLGISGAKREIVNEMRRRFPDHAPQELKRRNL